MPTPVPAVIQQIADDWVATTPPDYAEFPYEYVDDRPIDEGSYLAERAFAFLDPRRGSPAAETTDSAFVVWELQAVLVLVDNGRTEAEFVAAIANEQSLLLRTVELRTVWPQGVWAVLTEPADVVRDEESGAATITFTFSVHVGET